VLNRAKEGAVPLVDLSMVEQRYDAVREVLHRMPGRRSFRTSALPKMHPPVPTDITNASFRWSREFT
jgi:hypothetical protein